MNTSELMGGKPFARQYELQDILGTGATATVFKARDIHANKLVAVKVFEPNQNKVEIQREAQTQARLHHRNVLPFHWYGVEGEHPYIAMMLARQGSLAQNIRQEGRFSVDDAVRYVLEAAEGVQYAHGEGVVHRDLKPNNLLLHPTDESSVRVSDWGIAVKAHTGDSDFTTQFPRGTAAYAAPELLDGRSTAASDIYSLGGVVTFEFATGERPFKADTDGAYIRAHMNDQPPTFEQVLGDDMTNVHAAIEVPIQKALAKAPEDHQPSMGDYAEELHSAYSQAKGIQRKDRTTIDLGNTPRRDPTREYTDVRAVIGDSPATKVYTADLPATGQAPVELEAATVSELQGERARLQGRLDEVNRQLRDKESSEIQDPLKQAERAHPMIERAKEILGRDFLGVEAVRKMEDTLRGLGRNVEFVFDKFFPSFPYTERDLQIARENREMLVLRPPAVMMEDMRLVPMGLERLEELFNEGTLSVSLENIDQYDRGNLRAQWKLVRKEPISGSVGVDLESQRNIEAQYENGLYMKKAANIKINRRTTAEAIWDTLTYYYTNNEFLLSYPELIDMSHASSRGSIFKAGGRKILFDAVKLDRIGNSGKITPYYGSSKTYSTEALYPSR